VKVPPRSIQNRQPAGISGSSGTASGGIIHCYH
jgi:hypothetical protein